MARDNNGDNLTVLALRDLLGEIDRWEKIERAAWNLLFARKYPGDGSRLEEAWDELDRLFPVDDSA